MSENLVLYAVDFSPFVEAVELALFEAKGKYTKHIIPLGDKKPAWYAEKVNPSGKVPAITYGGQAVSPDQPSPESFKLAESTVILEFIADLYPDSTLYPKDVKLRASARFFVYKIVDTVLPAFIGPMFKKEPTDRIIKAFEEMQALMDPDHSKLIVGDEFTIADAAFIPVAWRIDVFLKNDVGSYPVGDGLKVYKAFAEGPQFARFRAYLATVKARPSFQKFMPTELLKVDPGTRLVPKPPGDFARMTETPENLVLYAADFSPFVEAVELALIEVKQEYTKHVIPMGVKKPIWYIEKVNPAGKVPAITYGGPSVSPDQPSPEAYKLAESTVILEFIADLHPESTLLPTDPKLRASVRFFIYRFGEVIRSALHGPIVKQEPAEVLLDGFEKIQALMQPGNDDFVVGTDFTIADAILIPFVWRLDVWLKNDIGSYPLGDGIKAHKVFAEDPKFAHLRAYFAKAKTRPPFQQIVIKEDGLVKDSLKFNSLRAANVVQL
ncbi:hypothetical protein HGRIS_000088 [Hohenbuehelia grisea]|uniref:Glutathione S-transferase n=1 Tax=Hohenbuehelia grisea TaxID=104357 RepID=A0ABR3JQY9_9AGAR